MSNDPTHLHLLKNMYPSNIIINIIVAIHYQSKYQNGGRIIRALQYPSGGGVLDKTSKTRESVCSFHASLPSPSSLTGHHRHMGTWTGGKGWHTIFSANEIMVLLDILHLHPFPVWDATAWWVCASVEAQHVSARVRPRTGDVDTFLLTTSSALLPATILSSLLSLKRELRSTNLMMIQTAPDNYSRTNRYCIQRFYWVYIQCRWQIIFYTFYSNFMAVGKYNTGGDP